MRLRSLIVADGLSRRRTAAVMSAAGLAATALHDKKSVLVVNDHSLAPAPRVTRTGIAPR